MSLRDGEGLARSRNAEQNLIALALSASRGKCRNGLRLIARGLEIGFKGEFLARFGAEIRRCDFGGDGRVMAAAGLRPETVNQRCHFLVFEELTLSSLTSMRTMRLSGSSVCE